MHVFGILVRQVTLIMLVRLFTLGRLVMLIGHTCKLAVHSTRYSTVSFLSYSNRKQDYLIGVLLIMRRHAFARRSNLLLTILF